jgi:low temperature requirement protein LtrA
LSIHYLLRPPRLWPADPTGSSRRVTWLELFFDLIFVAAVAQVGVPLSHAYTLEGLGRYIFFFVLIWWAWLGHTFYSTRFDTDDLLQRALTLAQIFAAALMAANAKDALDSRNSAGFGAAYAAMRIVLVVQYLRARRIPETRRLTTHFALGYGGAALLWVTAAVAPTDLRFWLWGVALCLDLGTPLLALRFNRQFPPDAAHLPERFGLFTIILLGESVAAVMKGIESQETWSPPAATSAILGLVMAFAIWWWYFDGAAGAAERHVQDARSARWFDVWNYAHFPMYLGIAVSAVGVEHVIALAPGEHLHGEEVWMIVVSAFVAMSALVTIEMTADSAHKMARTTGHLAPRFALAALALVLGLFGQSLPPVGLVAGLTALLAVQVTLATRNRLRDPMEPEPASLETSPDFVA